MQKIVPHLWFDTQAKAAAEFYAATFPDSKIVSSIVLHNTPSQSANKPPAILAYRSKTWSGWSA